MSKVKLLCYNVGGIRSKQRYLNFISELNRYSPDLFAIVDIYIYIYFKAMRPDMNKSVCAS